MMKASPSPYKYTPRQPRTQRTDSNSSRQNQSSVNSQHNSCRNRAELTPQLKNQYFSNQVDYKFKPIQGRHIQIQRQRVGKGSIEYGHKGGKHNEKQVNAMRSTIEKISAQITKKDRLIANLKSKNLQSKQYESQLIEAYRVTHFCQGKIEEMEKNQNIYLQSKHFNQSLEKLGEHFKDNFLKIKDRNTELAGKLQEKQHELQVMQNKLRKSQNKCLSLYRRIKSSQINYLKDSVESLPKQMASERPINRQLQQDLPAKIRQQLVCQFRGKIDKIESDFKFLQEQHRIVVKQLELKTLEAKRLYEEKQSLLDQIMELKQLYEKGKFKPTESRLSHLSKSDSNFSKTQSKNTLKSRDSELQKVVVLPRAMLNQIKRPATSVKEILSRHQLSEKDSSTKSSKPQTQADIEVERQFVPSLIKKDIMTAQKGLISDLLIRKVRYQCMRSQLNHKELIQLFLDAVSQSGRLEAQNLREKLASQPFYLQEEDIETIIDSCAAVEPLRFQTLLKQTFTFFKNVSLMEDITLVSQISNVFRNRQEQVERTIELKSHKLQHKFIQKLLADWGLSANQIDFVGLKAYQLTEDLSFIDFQLISEYFLRN